MKNIIKALILVILVGSSAKAASINVGLSQVSVSTIKNYCVPTNFDIIVVCNPVESSYSKNLMSFKIQENFDISPKTSLILGASLNELKSTMFLNTNFKLGNKTELYFGINRGLEEGIGQQIGTNLKLDAKTSIFLELKKDKTDYGSETLQGIKEVNFNSTSLGMKFDF